MTTNSSLAQAYAPDHDERSRQAFVGALKGEVNGPVEEDLAGLYEQKIKPAFVAEQGREPGHRDDVIPAFKADPLYQTWGSMVYTSQDMMWETVGDTVDRIRPEFEARAKALSERGQPLGTLELNPDLDIPQPIADREIHRQPGNYFFENTSDDLTTGLLYMGTIELYRRAKGLGTGSEPGQPGMGPHIVKVVEDTFPGFEPARILDLGCAVGTETVAYKERWPNAEVHGIDLSGPFVRFAHLWAEDKGLEMHFHQMNAAMTSFPDNHFDLIVSHILFHETWFDVQDQIMAETRRLLAPGGHMVHGDVPYQPSEMPMTKQVTNNWQVYHNGEPYWSGFADQDVCESMVRGGYQQDEVFAKYVPMGQAKYYFFGATKTAS